MLENITVKQAVAEGQVSPLYKMSADDLPECSKLKSWRLDLREEISEEERSAVCLKAQAQTIHTEVVSV